MLATILYDKTSRLYKTFIDRALATDVVVYCYQLKDPALFQSFVTLAPKVTHERAENLLKETYREIAEDGVTAAELASAKQSWRLYRAHRLDGPYALLSSINEDLATGDWTRFVTLPEAIANVSRADVRRIARTYFTDDQSTVGWFVAKNT